MRLFANNTAKISFPLVYLFVLLTEGTKAILVMVVVVVAAAVWWFGKVHVTRATTKFKRYSEIIENVTALLKLHPEFVGSSQYSFSS